MAQSNKYLQQRTMFASTLSNITSSAFVSFFLLFILLLLSATPSLRFAAAAKAVFRKNHLDYLNPETLEFYLSQQPLSSSSSTLDYDVAILYYADWDRNSHKLAPVWAQIAKLLNAGSQDSKLIMGLFDCEANYEHMQACTHAGITHYPTLQYLTFSGQSLQRKTPKHATKFGGNWQYGDAILDWIKVMRGMSQWHRAGWGKRLRQLLSSKKVEKPALPIGIGINHNMSSSLSAPSSQAGAAAASGTAAAQATYQVSKLEEEKKKLQELTVRSSVMVEALLFPLHRMKDDPRTMVTEGGKNYTDVFTFLSLSGTGASASDTIPTSNASSSRKSNSLWLTPDAALSNDELIVKTCVQDMALDYCERTTTRVLEDILISASKDGSSTVSLDDWSSLQKQAQVLLGEQEPYCLILDDCILSNFVNETCRPAACPFQDKAACRYLTSCLFKSFQEDYATALGIKLEQPSKTTIATGGTQPSTSTTGASSSSSSSSAGSASAKDTIATTDKKPSEKNNNAGGAFKKKGAFGL